MMQSLWRHSVGCAVSAQWIANRSGLAAKAQEAFTAGLLHDIGKLLILTTTGEIKRAGTIKQNPSDDLLGEVMDNYHTYTAMHCFEPGTSQTTTAALPATTTRQT